MSPEIRISGLEAQAAIGAADLRDTLQALVDSGAILGFRLELNQDVIVIQPNPAVRMDAILDLMEEQDPERHRVYLGMSKRTHRDG